MKHNVTQVSSTGRQENLSTLSITFLNIDRGTSAPAPEEETGGLDVWVVGLPSSTPRESRLMYQGQPTRFSTSQRIILAPWSAPDGEWKASFNGFTHSLFHPHITRIRASDCCLASSKKDIRSHRNLVLIFKPSHSGLLGTNHRNYRAVRLTKQRERERETNLTCSSQTSSPLIPMAYTFLILLACYVAIAAAGVEPGIDLLDSLQLYNTSRPGVSSTLGSIEGRRAYFLQGKGVELTVQYACLVRRPAEAETSSDDNEMIY
uniref:Uncharacterized protein n=1 Tax=Timema shepardi TaxID=629360 RepID=A0A7R9AU79_TIMSH|nr:unnamed protein product [Timema shepardi]